MELKFTASIQLAIHWVLKLMDSNGQMWLRLKDQPKEGFVDVIVPRWGIYWFAKIKATKIHKTRLHVPMENYKPVFLSVVESFTMPGMWRLERSVEFYDHDGTLLAKVQLNAMITDEETRQRDSWDNGNMWSVTSIGYLARPNEWKELEIETGYTRVDA